MLQTAVMQETAFQAKETSESHDAEEGNLGTFFFNRLEIRVYKVQRMTPSLHANCVESFQSEVDLGLRAIKIFLK